MNILGWFTLELTGLISLKFNGLLGVYGDNILSMLVSEFDNSTVVI